MCFCTIRYIVNNNSVCFVRGSNFLTFFITANFCLKNDKKNCRLIWTILIAKDGGLKTDLFVGCFKRSCRQYFFYAIQYRFLTCFISRRYRY